jgi:hypothetical protein
MVLALRPLRIGWLLWPATMPRLVPLPPVRQSFWNTLNRVTMAFVLVTMAASLVPARRATHVDPLVAYGANRPGHAARHAAQFCKVRDPLASAVHREDDVPERMSAEPHHGRHDNDGNNCDDGAVAFAHG